MHPIPETVAEAIAAWDADESVFTVEMGGIGPGYEMAIQALAFQFMREIGAFSEWDDDEKREALDARLDVVVKRCNEEPWGGFSGAQVGSAKNLAAVVCRRGYRNALRDPAANDRLIQVCRRDLRQTVAA